MCMCMLLQRPKSETAGMTSVTVAIVGSGMALLFDTFIQCLQVHVIMYKMACAFDD